MERNYFSNSWFCCIFGLEESHTTFNVNSYIVLLIQCCLGLKPNVQHVIPLKVNFRVMRQSGDRQCLCASCLFYFIFILSHVTIVSNWLNNLCFFFFSLTNCTTVHYEVYELMLDMMQKILQSIFILHEWFLKYITIRETVYERFMW